MIKSKPGKQFAAASQALCLQVLTDDPGDNTYSHTFAYIIDTCFSYLLISSGLHYLTFGNNEIHLGQTHGNHIICKIGRAHV